MGTGRGGENRGRGKLGTEGTDPISRQQKIGEQACQLSTPESEFAGLLYDPATNLYNASYRNHSVSQGHWMSPDPSGLAAVDPGNPQSWNRYAYVGNNPVSFVDPLGLRPGGDCDTADAGCYGNGGGLASDPDEQAFDNQYSSFGVAGLLAQQNGWYARCVSYNFQCDANGNYVPPDGGYVITVSCGGSFAKIDCAPPPQAAAGSQLLSIFTSLGMQNGLSLLAQYQADPMSSSGKDILQQLSQMSGAAQEFIIMGYGSSALAAGAVGAVEASVAAGASDSTLFGTAYYGSKGVLNGGALRLGGTWNDATQTLYFGLHSDWFHWDWFEWWP